MRYAEKITKTGTSVPGWATGTVRWYEYEGMTCQQAHAAFRAIPTWAGRVAATTANQPNLGSTRDCIDTSNPEPAKSYSNVVIIGNSITDYGAGKGYDASTPEKDYKHILTARHVSLSPGVLVRSIKDFPGRNVADGPYFESDHGKMEGGFSRFDGIRDSIPDLLYMSIGENVADTGHDFAGDYVRLVKYLTSKAPNCLIIARCTIWGKADIDNTIENICTENKWIFVNGRNMPGAMAGADNHPNDTGMQNLADLFWSATPKTIVTPTTPPPIGDTNLAGLPSFEAFNYQPISDNANNWTDFDPRTNMDGVIGEWVGLSNGQSNVRVYKRFGAVPAHISGPDGANRINIHDLGTMNGMTLYREGPISANSSAQISDQWGSIGNDPIQMGDCFGHPSPVLYMARNANMIYTITQMNNWPANNDLTDVILHQWVVLQGRGVHVYTRTLFNRTTYKNFCGFRAQEFPTFFTDAKYRTLGFVNGSGNVQFIANQPGQFDIPVTKPWVALAESSDINAQAIGLGADGLYMTSQWQKSLNEGTGELSNAAGYSQWRAFMHMDWNQELYSHHYWVVGTVNEIKQYCEAQPSYRNRLVWKFNTRWGRGHNCWKNGIDEGFPTYNDGIEITKQGNGEFYIKLPYMAIPASSVSALFIRYRSVGFSSLWRLVITRTGQGEGEKFLIDFNTQNDNEWHTLVIPLTGSEWHGYIQQFKLSNDGAANGSKIKIAWYNTVDADPEP